MLITHTHYNLKMAEPLGLVKSSGVGITILAGGSTAVTSEQVESL